MIKRFCSILLLTCLLLNMFAGINVFAAYDTADGYITVSVEKFTLGQGYIIEPIKVPFNEGDNGAKLVTDLLTEYLGEDSYENTGSVESEFYLTKVRDEDTGYVNIPQYILDEIGSDPVRRYDEGWLGASDYTSMSGWMSTVNNRFADVGPSDYFPEDGDVMRVQFSVYGYGADLGVQSDWGQPYIIAADKDALTAKIGEINSAQNKDEILSNPMVKTAYNNAYEVLKNMESTQDEVDGALSSLNDAIKAVNEESKITIAAITPVEDVTVRFGTSQAKAISSLAKETTITDNKENVHVVKLNWTIEGYDANKAGEYIATAPFDLPEGVSQAEPALDLKVSAKVIVAEKANPNESIQLVREILTKNLAYIFENTPNPTFGTSGGEWSILSLARGGYEVSEGYYDIYYNNVVTQVKKLMPASSGKAEGRLDKNKSTEHSRLIIGLTSIGKDITDVGGYDIRDALVDFDYVKKQGINGPIFALIALDSHNYEIPVIDGVANQSTRDMCIDFILGKEIKKGTENAGGWALSGTSPDPDITSMAIQALTPYYEKRQDVKDAIDRAITWLSNAQKEDGGYASWGSVNSESIAQVIVALTGLGIDPHTDARFVKNGYSAVDALLTYAVPGGGFMHVKPGGSTGGGAAAGAVNDMATDQATYALVSYIRFIEGKTSLYDMTDVQLGTIDPVNPEEPKENETPVIEEDSQKIEVPADDTEYNIPISKEDGNKEISIEIPTDKTSKVTVTLPINESLPQIMAVKGDVSAVIPKGAKVISSDTSDIELITSKDKTDNTIKEKLNKVIPEGKKLDEVLQALSMGGSSRVEFSDFVELTFAGMKGMEAAYIENGTLYPINRYSSNSKGSESGKSEYAYDNGEDLVVKTKHFTDFVVYAVSTTEASTDTGGGKGESGGSGSNGGSSETPKSKKYVTLSIDKLTINKGYVLKATQVEFEDGESVWDVLKRELDRRGIEYEYRWTEKYNSVYIELIDGDGEFDHGSGSGWMYSVNNWYPNYGASLYKLKDGDVVKWRYTTNLGADLGEDITKWDHPTISVEGIKDNQKATEKELTFKVTAKDVKGKSLTPIVKFNGKEITGTNGNYKVSLVDGKNTIIVIAVDADGNRAEKTYNITYNPSSNGNSENVLNPNNSANDNGNPTISNLNNPADGNTALSNPNNLTDEKGNAIITDSDLSKIYSDASSISSWALEAVGRATQNGFVTGFDGKFNPKANITRAEFATIMVSVLGLDVNIDKVISFTDVEENHWFYPFVNTAYKAGIIKGNGNNKFNPNDNITREQMAVIIVKALEIKQTKANTEIKDFDKVSDWAKADVETAVAIGLMIGDNGNFDPKAFATREMATVVAMKGYDYINDNETKDKNVEDKENLDVKNQIKETAEFMQKTITDPIVASVGGEWTVFGLSRSYVKVPEEYFEKYYANVEKTLKEKSGILHRIKYTEYDRVILALTSIGKNVNDVAGYDLTKPLADFNTLIKQGINGPIFALIALDSNNYEIPKDDTVKVQTTRQMLIDFILDREIAGGGWALGENPPEADPDITAMAIQSLVPYYEKDDKVKAAVDRGIEWLSKVQKDDGGYSSWGSVNSESIAQVIIALTSLGIDPHNDPRFIKNGNSAVEALLSFSVPGGGFYHIKPGEKGNGGANPGEVDAMATDQAMLALVAYDRFVNGQNRIYDMTDVEF